MKTRLPIVVLAVAALALPAGTSAAANTGARVVYERAFARLAHARSFEFDETVKVLKGQKRTVRTDIRFVAPHRLRMLVMALVPPPSQTLETIQVGRVRCQIPPGTCFRAALPRPVATVRALLVAKTLRLSYRSARDLARGLVIVKLSARTASTGGLYAAHLAIDASRGLPVSFSSTVSQGGRVYATQSATFKYGNYKITLPKGARIP